MPRCKNRLILLLQKSYSASIIIVIIIRLHHISDSAYYDRYIHTRPVTLVHPAKAIRRDVMPFGRDTRVASSNIVLNGAPVSPREGEILGRNPQLLRPVSRRDQ